MVEIIFHNKDEFSGSSDPSQPLCPLLPLPHQTCTLSGLSRKKHYSGTNKDLLWENKDLLRHKKRFTQAQTKTYYSTTKIYSNKNKKLL